MPPRTAAAKPHVASRARVLVIDDEPQMRRALGRMLRDHEVESFDDGHAALERLAQGARFDIVLCDLTMPKMSGVAFFRALAKVAPETRACVIFLTGGACSAEALDVIERFEVEVIEKPFDIDAVRAAVASRVVR